MRITRFFTTASAIGLGLASQPAFAGDVAGTVVDSSDTIALRSAEITIVELDRVAVTGRDGRFVIADVPAGTYTLEARYTGAPTQTLTITVPETGTAQANFALGGADGGEILVIGQGANLASALNRKRQADGVSDVLTRDAVGQFPDQNVAESLRRLPGINVLNDQGEGRFVSVRGLGPNLNATSVNGVRLPSPESDVRAVALDVVSSDIIESVEVKKSPTPDMDGDFLGASIEINTISAFDRRKDYYSVKAEASYNEYSDEITPKGSVDFAALLTPDIGISGGISYYRRFFESDNIEADDWDVDSGLVYAEEVQYRDYDVERERISASLGFDVRASDTTELYVRGLWSRFDDQEYRRRTTFGFDEAPSSGTGSTVTFDDADGRITVERDIKDRFERQEVKSLTAGGETDTGLWNFKYSASWAKSSEREDDSIDPTEFRRRFDGDGLSVTIDNSDPETPLYSVSGVADFFDPATYELNDVELTDLSAATDEEYSVKGDVARTFPMASGELTAQGGAKFRWRDKTYDADVLFYELDGYTLADVLGEPTYRITDIGPVASYEGATDYFFANRDQFELQQVDSDFDSAVSDYGVTEDVHAGYLLARWDSDTLRVVGGLRYEFTRNELTGNNVLLVEEDGTLPGGGTASDDTVIVTPLAIERDYDHWLPSITARYEPQDGLIFRLAGYRSLSRPKLSSLAPRFAVEQNDDDEVEGEFGNPDLLPYEAWNADAAVEYYMSSNGALTFGVFYKDVENYIVDVEYEADGAQLVYRGVAFDEAVIPFNGDSAEVFGVEVGFAQQWTMLPGALSGIITQANYTYTDATGTVSVGGGTEVGAIGETRTIPLPSTSKHTFNAVLGYEMGPFSFRVAGTYRDKYLDELSGSAEEDRYVDDHFQVDLSAKYRITPNIQVFGEWINVNDADYFAYNRVGGQQNNYQYERYGSTFKLGAKATF